MAKFNMALALGGLLAAVGLAGVAERAEAACWVKVPYRPVYRTFVHREIVEPGVYEVVQTPGLHGQRLSGPLAGDEDRGRVLLRPYRNYTRYSRPIVRYWRERVLVQPEGYRWRKVRTSHCPGEVD